MDTGEGLKEGGEEGGGNIPRCAIEVVPTYIHVVLLLLLRVTRIHARVI